MEVSLFGPLLVISDGRTLRGRAFGGAKPRGILELLLLSRGRGVSKDALADALWESGPPKNVSGTIEQYISLLRRTLFDGSDASRRVIVTEAGAYRIDTERVDVDLDRFDSLVLRAERVDVATRRTLLTDAVALAVGDLIEDAPYAPWVQWERHVYRGRISRAHMALADESALAGRHVCAVRHSEAALQFAPHSEHVFQIIMLSNYALGRRDLAQIAYARCCEMAASLDLAPTKEVVEIAAAIASGSPASDLIERYIAPWRSPVGAMEPVTTRRR